MTQHQILSLKPSVVHGMTVDVTQHGPSPDTTDVSTLIMIYERCQSCQQLGSIVVTTLIIG